MCGSTAWDAPAQSLDVEAVLIKDWEMFTLIATSTFIVLVWNCEILL